MCCRKFERKERQLEPNVWRFSGWFSHRDEAYAFLNDQSFEGNWLNIVDGTTPAVLGFGALFAIVLGAYDYTGGRLTGYRKDPEGDEFATKEYLRRNRRRPIEQTIAEVGEGRGMSQLSRLRLNPCILIYAVGIYAPGYEERRRERIKATYGIDVPTKNA